MKNEAKRAELIGAELKALSNYLSNDDKESCPKQPIRLFIDRAKKIVDLCLVNEPENQPKAVEGEVVNNQILETVKGSDGILLNANDFFNYACSDCITLDPSDFHWSMPIIAKYGNNGENAVMSKIANTLPLEPYINNNFTKALKEINSKDIKVVSEW